MKTLIELYDERAFENTVGPETFLPEKVVYLCPGNVFNSNRIKSNLCNFLSGRGLDFEIEFVECSQFDTGEILNKLHRIASNNKDCVMDITGGNDAALFASGMFCKEANIPAFTYSRRNNCFFGIHPTDYLGSRPCTIKYNVSDFFTMTGGVMKKGRVDNKVLSDYEDIFYPFFELFLRHRKSWVKNIVFMQRISKIPKDMPIDLHVSGDYIQKGDNGSRISANPGFLEDLKNIGFLSNININEKESISFDFKDEVVRGWLRDVGSVLELFMYKVCKDTGIFQDVVSSAVVDWYEGHDRGVVSNEIDVVAARNVIPLFISCKISEIKTEYLNELSVLKERFGGKGSKSVIVSTEYCNAAVRHRAAQLGIAVMDIEELTPSDAANRIKIIMKV